MLFGYILISAIAIASVFAGTLLAGALFNGAERARITVANRDEPWID